MRQPKPFFGFIVVAAFAGCGPDHRGGNNGGPDGGNGTDGNNNGGDGNQNGCSAASMLVYTVDQNNTFSTFDPMTKTFHDVGTLSCASGAMPFSMGIDRTPSAWVEYDNGKLFHVDVTTLACTPTSWSNPDGLLEMGMGFSTDQVGGTTDKLFVAGGLGPTFPTSTLATVDTGSMAATMLGTVTGWPELTGNGNAELWGWFPDASHPRVEQINKTSGAAIKTFKLDQLAGMPMAWAFAFWGGDYWIFLERSTDSNTTVYQIDGMTGAIKGSTPEPNRTIVGAGVSTCAPVVIE
jgi:hypothetical protein